MDLNEYAEWTSTTAQYPDSDTGNLAELQYLALGLCSESGEVAGEVKRLYRDGDTEEGRKALESECSDCYWYLSRLCKVLGVKPETLLEKNVAKLMDRKNRGKIGGRGSNR